MVLSFATDLTNPSSFYLSSREADLPGVDLPKSLENGWFKKRLPRLCSETHPPPPLLAPTAWKHSIITGDHS